MITFLRGVFLVVTSRNYYQKEEFMKQVPTESDTGYNRIFTLSEKFHLELETQGLLKKIIFLNILSPAQSEQLINSALQSTRGEKYDYFDIWNSLKDIVNEEQKLEEISQKVQEFNNIYYQDFKHIN